MFHSDASNTRKNAPNKSFNKTEIFLIKDIFYVVSSLAFIKSICEINSDVLIKKSFKKLGKGKFGVGKNCCR